MEMSKAVTAFRSTMTLRVSEDLPAHEKLLRRRCNASKRHGNVQVYAPHLRVILDELEWYRNLYKNDGLVF